MVPSHRVHSHRPSGSYSATTGRFDDVEMAQWVNFSNWPGLKPGVDGAPRKKRWASLLSLERPLLAVDVDVVVVLSSLLVEGIVESELKFSGTKTCREEDCFLREAAGDIIMKAEASFIRVVDVSRKKSTAEQRRRLQLIRRIMVDSCACSSSMSTRKSWRRVEEGWNLAPKCPNSAGSLEKG